MSDDKNPVTAHAHFWSPWVAWLDETPLCLPQRPQPSVTLDGQPWFAVSRLASEVTCPLCLEALEALRRAAAGGPRPNQPTGDAK